MPETLTKLKVLVVDDHAIIRMGVRHLLGDSAEITDAESLVQARAALGKAAFDLMLLDLGLGDEFSLTGLPLLRQSAPAMKIIVLTSMDEALYAEKALRAGADGFVMKSEIGTTLQTAVNTVMSGQVHVSSALASTLLRRMAGGGNEASSGRADLSPREIEVLRLVAGGKSTREIADALNRSVKTIETHKQSLKTKLGADSPARLVRMALAWFGDNS
jgi:two-component system, NarL family, response regulator FusR